jgi:hypothetical protein
VSVKVWVGRFAIVEGQAQEEGPLLRSFPRQRPDEEEDELYVLVEPATPGSRQYCGQLVDAVGQMYQQDTLSITGAALRALRAAHHQLYDWNQRTLREQQVGAGISSLAVRERTAYLSLAGPAVAYHVGDGRFRRIAPEGPAAEPLGVSEWAEPTFDRYQLSPGDLLLIASPRIDELIGQDELRTMLLKGGDEALVELFRAVREQQEFGLVLLACVVEPESDALPIAPVPLPATPDMPPPPLEPAGPSGAAEAPASEQAAEEAIGPPPSLEEDLQREQALPEPIASYPQPRVRLKGNDAGVTYRHPTGLGAALPRIPPIAIVGAIVLIIVGLLAWYIVPQALQESKDEKYASAVSDARSDLANALATQDPAQQRTLLRAASTSLEDAERARPNQQEVADLRAQVETQLNKLNAILLLPDLEQVTDLSGQVPGPISPRDLAIGGGGAYFLDRQGGRVIAISLLAANPDPISLFQSGDLVGDQVTGRPTHVAWAEGLQSLLVLDDANRLFAIAAGAPSRLLPVRDSDTWGSADGIAYVGSDLYVMDRQGNQVWRYPPSESGFDSEREGLLSGFDLGRAVEMAAAGDGLYFLTSDNNIVRAGAAAGGTQPFSQAGIDTPLSSPGSLLPVPGLSLVMVADRGNSRIVEFGTDGTFKQQLVNPQLFNDLRSIAVDEPNRLLYILVSGALYRTPLPPLP